MAANIYVGSAMAAAMLLAGSGFAARAQSSQESPAGNTGAIKEVISVYEAALNASSADAMMPLYADDGVFMPPYNHAGGRQGSGAGGLRCGIQGDHSASQVQRSRSGSDGAGLGVRAHEFGGSDDRQRDRRAERRRQSGTLHFQEER